MKQDDMEKEKKKCSGTYLEDSHPDIYPESVKEESGYYVATKKNQGACISMFAPDFIIEILSGGSG